LSAIPAVAPTRRRRHVRATSACHEHLQAWPHHAVQAKGLRDSVKLVQVEASTPSSLNESLEDDVHADLVAEPGAVDHGAQDAVLANRPPLDAMLLDSDIEQWPRNPRHAKRRYVSRGTRVPRGTASQTSRGSWVPTSWKRRADRRHTTSFGTVPQAAQSSDSP
jgi:hypothetical protein